MPLNAFDYISFRLAQGVSPLVSPYRVFMNHGALIGALAFSLDGSDLVITELKPEQRLIVSNPFQF